jgi:hypothetical protein
MSAEKTRQVSGREELGQHFHVTCGRAIVEGIQETLGKHGARALLIQTGRKRGLSLSTEADISASDICAERICEILINYLGQNGTRLCLVERVTGSPDRLTVEVSNLIEDSENCSYTLGVFTGFLEGCLNEKFQGQIESIGASHSAVISLNQI